MQKLFLLAGSIAMALAVTLGAFGAHGLKSKLSAEMLDIFETGVQYHFYHAIGLLIVGLLAQYLPDSPLIKWSGWLIYMQKKSCQCQRARALLEGGLLEGRYPMQLLKGWRRWVSMCHC